MDRRTFISSATAAASLAAVSPKTAFGAAANETIQLGIIGCGGRGGWLADLFKKQGYKVTAVADYFKDRVDRVGGTHEVPENRRFTGLGCHKKLLEAGGVDAVAIITPPYFHPEQAADAVAKGLHVYLAKPIAVDAPGCRSIAASGQAATEKGLVFLVDFQTRADPFYTEALRRVHEDGALGDFCFGESLYHANRLGKKDAPGASPNEVKLRNWVFDKTLSGDIITEQNIHTLDVMNWIMNATPVQVTGSGGRKVRIDVGDCWDHFSLVYQYPNNVGVTFSSRQFQGHGTPGGIINRMFGSKGVLLTKYGGEVLIRGGKDTFYRGGKSPGIYRDGVVANMKTFQASIKNGDTTNPTVAPSVQSNLITIMGRTAAYEGRTVTWDEIKDSQVSIKADLSGLTA